MSSALTRRRKASPRKSRPEVPVDAFTPPAYFKRKAALDFFVAAVLLVPGLPMMLICMAIIRLTSKGPAIYKQTRVGLHGRSFVMYKLRTMGVDAEVGTGAVWTSKNDPRITRAGRIMRKLHLDELPQLFNVLRGEMSLIGPRPERPEFTQTLAVKIPGYMKRHAVRPGVTGLAQINLPPDTDLDSVRRKLVLDLKYASEGNAWMDFRIFAATFLRLFGIHSRTSLGVLGLRHVPLVVSQVNDSSCNSSGSEPHGAALQLSRTYPR